MLYPQTLLFRHEKWLLSDIRWFYSRVGSNNSNSCVVRRVAAQPCIVVIGAGHLVGDKGIPNLLKNAGFDVGLVMS